MFRTGRGETTRPGRREFLFLAQVFAHRVQVIIELAGVFLAGLSDFLDNRVNHGILSF